MCVCVFGVFILKISICVCVNRGLFIGIDFVTNQETRTPAPLHTSIVTTLLKEKYHILTSIDGPDHNVIVMKPPLQFSMEDSDKFVSCLSEALLYVESLGEQVNNAQHTPT
jgi:4-aminobutyrate aminotransferase-like enzyme